MGATAFDQTPSPLSPSQIAGLVPAANVLVNSDFRINQRVYVSAAALAAGVYGHDRWKAGAAGGDYSFTQLASSTQITIASGKSLIQVVEDKNVEGGTYVLSWEGTAQMRVGVNTATPASAYASSPIVVSGQTAGTVMSVEANAGTLGRVKLERGSVKTPFVMGNRDDELSKCEVYLEYGHVTFGPAATAGSQDLYFGMNFRKKKRANPTVTRIGTSISNGTLPGGASGTVNSLTDFIRSTAAGAVFVDYDYKAEAEL